ncbi:MAG: DUF3095 domain-containing protein [Roseobacter sp.]|nr:DUF3095 domain-containing protein [Roseobacter sp.]
MQTHLVTSGKGSGQDPLGGFYDTLPRETEFSVLADTARFHPLPEGWLMGVADIKGSTDLIARGAYKTVNMAGAAVISAVLNEIGSRSFPFVFGGDGAGLAVAPQHDGAARRALAAVACWAKAEFGIDMRVAVVPVSAARAMGYDVRVARFAVSQGADYAMFSGGGLAWAEEEMKAGRYLLERPPAGARPDLTGLSCRWANMRSSQGHILSLVVAAVPDAPAAQTARAYRDIFAIVEGLSRSGHPAPAHGMEVRRAPLSARLEAQAIRGTKPMARARLAVAFEATVYRLLYKFNLRLGGFDPRHYARTVMANADFRKLDDGLKMTLDCDPETARKLEERLAQAARDGVLRYGIAMQDEAMMTCIVPSPITDDHLHFIDGAAGGYTKAASQMKAR